KMASKWEHHVDVGADALDQPTNFGKVGPHIEGAVDRSDDIDSRLDAIGAWLALRDLLYAVLFPEPDNGAICALPLVFVDGARQEPLDIGSLRCDAAA